MLDKETVEHIARLARIGVTSEEVAQYQSDLSSILDFFDEMKQVESAPGASLEELSRVNQSREDREQNALPEVREQIITNMPHTKDGSLSVQSVLSV